MSKISKKISALRPKLRRLPCPGVHGPLRGACESSRGLTLPQARSLGSTSRVGGALLCRTAPRAGGEVHSMFAVRCHGNNPLTQQTKCIVCTRRAGSLLVAPVLPSPLSVSPETTRHAFSRHGRNRCRGEEMPPDRTRHTTVNSKRWRVPEGFGAVSGEPRALAR